MTRISPDYDAIVIGAGFSGVRSLWELQRLGLTARCFDAGSDVGGTWWWNRYPGCRTDGEAWVYALKFLPELLEEWDFTERYPSQEEIQWYLSRVLDRYDLRKNIEFNTEVKSAHYSDRDNLWTVTTADGSVATARYFLPATGITSIPKEPPFPGLQSFQGEVYQASTWPEHEVDFQNKRIGVIGTGSTGIQVITKLAPDAEQLTVFQRTPNYVIPAQNYPLDEQKREDIKKTFDVTWDIAKINLAGHAVKHSGRTVAGVGDPEGVRQVFEDGWARGCYDFQLGTFDDSFMHPDANAATADFIREKIRSIVGDPETAEVLCPTYPFGARRPPCADGYYETFNRSNVKLVDISKDEIELYEKGIKTASGAEYELDIIILALGFDTGTGAMNKIDIRGSHSKSLRESWTQRLETFAGVLVHGYPNMFVVCGPHLPAGNQPVSLEAFASWIGKTIEHMETNGLASIDVSNEAMNAWTTHVEQVWGGSFLAKHAHEQGSWFVGTNIPGKQSRIMFYFGGMVNLEPWLIKEVETGWSSMSFTPLDRAKASNGVSKQTVGGVHVTPEMLESVQIPLEADKVGMSPAEKSKLVNAATAVYIDTAVEEMRNRGLTPKQDYRVHWWKVMQAFVDSVEGQRVVQETQLTKEGLESLISKLGIEGEVIARMGPEIVNILTGKTHALAHIMRDDLLFRVYLSDEGRRANRYMAEYARILTSQRRELRILEIGAGTGAPLRKSSTYAAPTASHSVPNTCFFNAAKTTLKKWEPLLTFKVLNIEDDPASQGFEEHTYDLIVAANVIHATARLTNTLSNVHKLLKPGGVFGLVELTRLTPFYNLAFGPLSGWWAGVDEGRTESPLQSPQQWNELLKQTGFSGIDLAAYDLPGPQRHSCLLLSTALANSVTNGH
ncbi:bifunctional monooxygenase/methyltransferase psoF [Aspergillus novofumigatus IBT 16806]|uniref:Putative steroid monooxygenase n=1 Tax=Aspergillus novofumigatus (strain IBT 16806) TaxID=1392255 RepID=A0A2I1BX65_ASPN1|nr:putative steroid monooxygenase [Aspergillus novofumigatus IBT 16806]PKX89979.1 putative steroid monooxygenase [Aspergillus novofumigatus IBT 16806]